MKISRIAFALAAAGAFAAAQAAPIVITNPSVKAGVSDYGTLGSNGATSPGILYDPTATGSYGVNDFLTPGTPWEEFYITGTSALGSFSLGSNNTGSSSFIPTSPTLLTSSSGTWTSTSTDGMLQVTNTYSIVTSGGLSQILMTTTITNLATFDLSDMQFLRATDPDPDVNAFGSYYTDNTLVSADMACGTGISSGQTICIHTTSGYKHHAGVSAPWSSNPADYLGGVDNGDGDYAIGMGFILGGLKAGESLTLAYDYRFGADLGTATGVPEPLSLALAGLGLVGVAASRRRRSV